MSSSSSKYKEQESRLFMSLYPGQQEELPRAITGPKEDDRFEETLPDYFWAVANWSFFGIIMSMGLIALKDMLTGTFRPDTMFFWVSIAVSGLAGLAFIHKIILTK